jgi:hypothetical protein
MNENRNQMGPFSKNKIEYHFGPVCHSDGYILDWRGHNFAENCQTRRFIRDDRADKRWLEGYINIFSAYWIPYFRAEKSKKGDNHQTRYPGFSKRSFRITK